MTESTWIVERTTDGAFPWRITIVRGREQLLALRAKDKWPGASGNIFCLRETEPTDLETLVEEERVPVLSMNHFGRKLSLVLDRGMRKRCDFLFLEKRYKHKEGTYEQIFFRTQAGVKAHRSRSRVNLFPTQGLEIAIDTRERYPWRFNNASTRRSRLPAGDYALYHDQVPIAVIERKTFDNLLTDMASLQVLHQQFGELASYPRAAVVVEARYGDFLDPRRLAGRWPATHMARVLAELSVEHPGLPVIYAGERKLANEWARGFFAAAKAKAEQAVPEIIARASAGHRQVPGPGLDVGIRQAVSHDMPDGFRFTQLANRFPDVPKPRLRRVLNALRDEGRLTTQGKGRGTRWFYR